MRELTSLGVGTVPECRDCGRDLGAGYLCDDCDELEVNEDA
jgi:hypothetical protein